MASRNPIPSCSPFRLGRRDFFAASGASLLAARSGLLGFPSTLLANETLAAHQPLIQVLFVGPQDDQYWMSWPGASFTPNACQEQCSQTLTQAAQNLEMQLNINPLRLEDPDGVAAVLRQLKMQPADGLVIVPMHLRSWPQTLHLSSQTGAIPTIVFAPFGTTFANRMQELRKQTKTLAVSTDDMAWLETGMRMLRTISDLQHLRICMVTDAAQGDEVVDSVGTTLHFVPMKQWVQAVQETKSTDEMKEFVKPYVIDAEEILEPTLETILDAAKNYTVARQIMADENCQAISVDCSPLICQKRVNCGPCLAWSRLLDEGQVAACEADADAAITQLIASRLLQRPGFMQDPAPNTVNNTIVASHCTCPTRLHGFDKTPAAYSLRSHSESNTGVAMHVEWQQNQPVTLMKFERPDTLTIGTGQVLRNVQSDIGGGCRTAVEIAVDGLEDVRDFQGFHQVVLCGKFDRELASFAELSGLHVRKMWTT